MKNVLITLSLFLLSIQILSAQNSFPGSGNVLLGTTDVTGQKLQVNGNIDITGNTSGRTLRFYDGTNYTGGIGNNLWAFGASASDLALYTPNNLIFGTNSNERFRIGSNGNVGIGTSSPGARFTTIYGTGNTGLAGLIRNEDATNGYGMAIESEGTSSTRYALTVRNLNASQTYFHISTVSGEVGNVGIGTSSPGARFTTIYGTGNTGLAGLVRNEDAANGYGMAIESEGTASTRYALTVRNLSASQTYFHISTVSGQVGNVGIGTTNPTEKLSVDGNVYASGNISAFGFIKTKKITVTQTDWPDYVFDKKYKLRSLSSLESFIQQNKHLPEVPSAKEVEEKGISVGDNQALLLKKIEELTLYLIAMSKENKKMKNEIAEMKNIIRKN